MGESGVSRDAIGVRHARGKMRAMESTPGSERTMRFAATLFLLAAAGCTSVDAPRPAPVQPASATPAPRTEAPVAMAPVAKAPASLAPSAAPAKKAVAAPPPPAGPGKAVAAPPPPATAGKPVTPPLDLNLLETRLKETPAIGVFTKLSLKNQVDDLLNQFRAFYKGALKTTLAELRRPYEMLLLKVLSLLQDADPPLAHAIVASREAIWGVLSDPAKFSTL